MQVIDINAAIGRRHGDEARFGRAALAADLDRHGVAPEGAAHDPGRPPARAASGNPG